MLAYFPMVLCAQVNITAQDSTKSYNYSWRSLALHTGVGVQKSPFIEIGPSLVSHYFDSRSGYVNGIAYSSFEWMPTSKIYGVKLGAEYGYNFFTMVVETKVLTDNKDTDLFITPKIGIGLGFVNLYYGYNFSTNNYPLSSIGKSQFSLVFNITKKYFKHGQN